MEQHELEKEWLGKYDIKAGRLKQDLSNECYEWAKKNPKKIDELTDYIVKSKLNDAYEAILSILRVYIDTTEENYKVIAIWIIGTYYHRYFTTYPYLFFNAMRGSGKTRTMKLVSALAANGDGSVQNNLTEAVLFRIPQGHTTCIDEVEQIGKKDKQTLRELLNSAYKKGMKVKRMRKSFDKEGEKQVVETFEPYFPICMANIWGMDEVLGDRSITLILEKSNNSAITKMIEDFDENPLIQQIKRTLSDVSVVSGDGVAKKDYRKRWNMYITNKYTTTLTTLYTSTTLTTLEEERDKISNDLKEIEYDELFNKIDKLDIAGRNLELFLPLMIVAQEIGVLGDFLEVAGKMAQYKKENEFIESKDVSLYDFVASKGISGKDYTQVKQLTTEFRMFLGDSDDEEQWLNERWLSRALRRLNLIKESRRVASGREITLDYIKAQEQLKIFKEKNDKTE